MPPREQPTALGPSASAPLVFGSEADETVVEHRSSRAAGLSARERLALAVVGGGFLAVLAALAALVPVQRYPGVEVVALYVVLYALVSRIEFEVFTGASVPTQLIFVPMLFVLPLRLVPLAVAAGLVVGYALDWLSGRIALERVALSVLSSWHAVGPVVVLAASGERELAWSSIPLYVVALAAQFATELAAIGMHERIAHGIRVRSLLPHLWRTQLVDAALAPAGLALAYAAQSEPYTVLLVLPLVGLLRVFAHERRARIDNALELSTAYRGTAFLLGDVVEADDEYTGLHSRDVVELAVAVAEELGLSEKGRRDTEFVALLHDVGKIRIPADIINKPGRLSPEERAVMETHTIEGERMLAQVGGLLGEVGHIVRSCHERFDGTGYPDGLAGEAIPQVARIVMCCDAYSAMTTDRPYRAALPIETALDELRDNAGTQFDPQVVGALVDVVRRGTLRREAVRV
jgi:HD-GYP domain-containing protein (c-di-GMP phosphodiesterase class II)